jgi:hypothetical protein
LWITPANTICYETGDPTCIPDPSYTPVSCVGLPDTTTTTITPPPTTTTTTTTTTPVPTTSTTTTLPPVVFQSCQSLCSVTPGCRSSVCAYWLPNPVCTGLFWLPNLLGACAFPGNPFCNPFVFQPVRCRLI